MPGAGPRPQLRGRGDYAAVPGATSTSSRTTGPIGATSTTSTATFPTTNDNFEPSRSYNNENNNNNEIDEIDDDEDDANDEIFDEIDGVDGAPRTATLRSATANISNTILGAGMLALPHALAAVGLALGAVLVAAAAAASAFGLCLLSLVAFQISKPRRNHRGPAPASFSACAIATYPHAAIFIDLAIAIKCFGVAVSYILICSDLFPQVIQNFFFKSPVSSPSSSPQIASDHWILSKQLWVSISILAIAPATFYRKLDSLKYMSAFALLAVVYLVVIVVMFCLDPPTSSTSSLPSAISAFGGMPFPPPKYSEIEWIKITPKFLTTLPVFIFAFTCHQNIFSVHNELAGYTRRKMNTVIISSITLSLVVYETIGVAGYLTFGKHTMPNIIAMYPPSSVVTIGQLAIALLVLLSYPLQCHPGRASLDKVVMGVAGMIKKSRGSSILSFSFPPFSSAAPSAPTRFSRDGLSDVASNDALLPIPSNASISAPHPTTNATNNDTTNDIDSVDETNALNTSSISVSPLIATPTPQHHRHEQPTPTISETIPPTRFTLITLSFLIASYIVAMTVTNLSTVLAFVGATGSTTIAYILPGLFYYRMRRDVKMRVLRRRQQQQRGDDVDNGEGMEGGVGVGVDTSVDGLQIAAVALTIFGICIMVSSITTLIYVGASTSAH